MFSLEPTIKHQLVYLFDVISRREHAIRELLGRHIQLSSQEAYKELEKFIIERLSLPPQWIHDAKVTTATAT